MARLKVLFLTNWYPTVAEPATAVWIREHAKAVQAYDDVVVLHCLGPDATLPGRFRLHEETDQRLTEGIRTCRWSHRPARFRPGAYPVHTRGLFRAARQVFAGGFRPQVIHAHVYDAGPAAVLLGAVHRVPVVVSEHFSSFPRRLLGRADVLKAWLAFRFADAVLPVSHSLQAAIEAYGIRARYRVVPNVADTALFTPSCRPAHAASCKRILFVGQLVPIKGIPTLLGALARLAETRSDWHLDIVGDGPQRGEYERRAAALQLDRKVSFHGIRSRQDVAAFMRRAHLLVLPSLCETFSVPVAEALAAGLPVLATRCGGPEEIVVPEVGELVAPDDVDALRGGLADMLDNLRRYEPEGIAAYARDRFSPERVGATLHDVYQSLVRPPG